MLEQVRKIKVGYNLFLGPSLPFLKWMCVLALLFFCRWELGSVMSVELHRRAWEKYFSQCCCVCLCHVTISLLGAKFAWLQVVWDFFLCPLYSITFPISTFSCWLFIIAVVFLFSFLFLHLPYLPAFSIGKCQEPGHVGHWLEPGLEGISQEPLEGEPDTSIPSTWLAV